MEKTRWKQRLENFKKADILLKSCLSAAHQDEKSDIAIIKSYEMAFELSWKTLQDFLAYQGTQTLGARDALKIAFNRGLISDGHLWLEMLDQRNALVHVYDQATARKAVDLISGNYSTAMSQLISKLSGIKE